MTLVDPAGRVAATDAGGDSNYEDLQLRTRVRRPVDGVRARAALERRRHTEPVAFSAVSLATSPSDT